MTNKHSSFHNSLILLWLFSGSTGKSENNELLNTPSDSLEPAAMCTAVALGLPSQDLSLLTASIGACLSQKNLEEKANAFCRNT
jgi:hypothetical protein